MGGLVEVIGLEDLDDVGDGLLGLEHGPQDRLLGIEVVRRYSIVEPDLSDRRSLRQICLPAGRSERVFVIKTIGTDKKADWRKNPLPRALECAAPNSANGLKEATPQGMWRTRRTTLWIPLVACEPSRATRAASGGRVEAPGVEASWMQGTT